MQGLSAFLLCKIKVLWSSTTYIFIYFIKLGFFTHVHTHFSNDYISKFSFMKVLEDNAQLCLACSISMSVLSVKDSPQNNKA